MDLQPYVEAVRHELTVAAAAGGPEAAELAERLTAPLESAIRLALLEALSEGAELITRELAPGSVEVRLRGRDPEFTLTPAPAEQQDAPPPSTPEFDDDGGTWRVTLRLPERLRTAVDSAARGAGLSVNAWMVRAIAGALGAGQAGRRYDGPSGKSFSGWVR
ncbi:histidine kinase [Mycobacterium sp.]|uniref:histidine kinase n=1 Tax=Mycobacterium sp. TaxID=1785 RepID=UPI002DA8ED67|nr:histidine kinase [Mycobacterium sp.]